MVDRTRYLFLFMTCLVVFCSGVVESGAGERDYRQTGITVTGSYSWKPYSFVGPDNEPAGFFIDFWNKWSEKTGVPVTFKLVTWGESISMVASGECDVQSGLYYTEERDQTFSFTKPVYFSKAVSFVGPGIQCSKDMTGLRWGGVNDTQEKASISRIDPDAVVVGFKDSIELLRAMDREDVQAAVDDWSTVMLLGSELGLSDSLTVCETMYQRDLLGIVLDGRPELLALINSGIEQITEEEKRYMVNRWFIEHEPEGDWHDNIMPVVIVVLLSVGIWLWSFRRRS